MIQKDKPNWIDKAQLFYDKAKAPLAYICLIIILGIQFIPETFHEGSFGKYTQLTFLVFLGILVIEMLFDINRRVRKEEKTLKRYDDWDDTILDLRSIIDTQLKNGKNGEVRIQCIGLAMRNYWQSMVKVIDPYLLGTKQTSVKLSLEMAMLSDSFFEKNTLSTELLKLKYQTEAKAKHEAIEAFKQVKKEKLDKLGWSIDLYTYDHLPNLYGVLIDDQYLFLGLTYWEGKDLRGAGTSYDLYRRYDKYGGSDKILIFKSWFNHIKESSKSKDLGSSKD